MMTPTSTGSIIRPATSHCRAPKIPLKVPTYTSKSIAYLPGHPSSLYCIALPPVDPCAVPLRLLLSKPSYASTIGGRMPWPASMSPTLALLSSTCLPSSTVPKTVLACTLRCLARPRLPQLRVHGTRLSTLSSTGPMSASPRVSGLPTSSRPMNGSASTCLPADRVNSSLANHGPALTSLSRMTHTT